MVTNSILYTTRSLEKIRISPVSFYDNLTSTNTYCVQSDAGGGLNHAHEHNESPRPLTRYDAVTYQTRENYNVLERGQRNGMEMLKTEVWLYHCL